MCHILIIPAISPLSSDFLTRMPILKLSECTNLLLTSTLVDIDIIHLDTALRGCTTEHNPSTTPKSNFDRANPQVTAIRHASYLLSPILASRSDRDTYPHPRSRLILPRRTVPLTFS